MERGRERERNIDSYETVIGHILPYMLLLSALVLWFIGRYMQEKSKKDRKNTLLLFQISNRVSFFHIVFLCLLCSHPQLQFFPFRRITFWFLHEAGRPVYQSQFVALVVFHSQWNLKHNWKWHFLSPGNAAEAGLPFSPAPVFLFLFPSQVVQQVTANNMILKNQNAICSATRLKL